MSETFSVDTNGNENGDIIIGSEGGNVPYVQLDCIVCDQGKIYLLWQNTNRANFPILYEFDAQKIVVLI